jgi:hypothetical protein
VPYDDYRQHTHEFMQYDLDSTKVSKFNLYSIIVCVRHSIRIEREISHMISARHNRCRYQYPTLHIALCIQYPSYDPPGIELILGTFTSVGIA